MSIIIPSASIYDKENQKVIKNNYSRISIKNDNVKESMGNYTISVTNYSIEKDDDGNITGITDVFYDSLGENSFYNNSVDDTYRYLRYVGAYIAKGEYLLDLATAKISSISISCIRVYYTDSSRTTVHSYGDERMLSKEDVILKFPTGLQGGGYSANQFVTQTDGKLYAENDLAFSMARWNNYKRPSINLIYYYWGDFSTSLSRSLFSDYLLVFFGFVSHYDTDIGAAGDNNHTAYARDFITSISITVEARKLEKEDNVQYSGDDNTRPFEMSESSLLTTKTYMQDESSKVQLAEWLVNRAYENYKDGIETATIRCSLVDYYNSDGVLEISPTNYSADNANTRMMFSVGDIVIPYVATPNGDRPMSSKPDGTPKAFRVTGVTLISDGAVWQELQLQEVSG